MRTVRFRDGRFQPLGGSMDPAQRRVLTVGSRVLSCLFGLLGLALAVTAVPREWTSDAPVPRPYVLSQLVLIERAVWFTACCGAAYYFHTLYQGFRSGALDGVPRHRLPWEPKP